MTVTDNGIHIPLAEQKEERNSFQVEHTTDCIYFATARGERTIPQSSGETFPYHDNNIIWIKQMVSNDSKASIRDTQGTWR